VRKIRYLGGKRARERKMTQHAFLLVCSVRPLDGADVNVVRSLDIKMALDGVLYPEWRPVTNLPGAISGSIVLRAITPQDKKSEALLVVRAVIRELLAKHEAPFDVIANAALMIDGLGDVMIFDA
jgi:hypothetical protein